MGVGIWWLGAFGARRGAGTAAFRAQLGIGCHRSFGLVSPIGNEASAARVGQPPPAPAADASNIGRETFACVRPTDDSLGGGRHTECACYRGAEREANGAGVCLLILDD